MFGSFIETFHLGFVDGEDRQLLAIPDEPLDFRLTGHFGVFVDDRNQQCGQIFRAQTGQFQGAFCDHDAFAHHLVSGLAACTHGNRPPYGGIFLHRVRTAIVLFRKRWQ